MSSLFSSSSSSGAARADGHANRHESVGGSPGRIGDPMASLDRAQDLERVVASTASERITEGLRNLKVGEVLLVDTNGHIHPDKQVFVDGKAEPLVSFAKGASRYGEGTFIVHAGVPPRNRISCLAARDIDLSRSEIQLRYPTILKSGDQISLADICQINVPDRIIESPSSSNEKLEALLARAEPGDMVSLGRSAVPSLPGLVSRIHCTVELLQKIPRDGGTFELTVRVFPGIPSQKPIYLKHDAGDHDQIIGQREVKSGLRIHLGDELGSVTIPHPPGSLEEVSVHASVMFTRGESVRAMEALESFIAPQHGAFSEGVRDNHRVAHSPWQVALKAETLREYICAGLKLISEGQHSNAIEHFRRDGVLALCGYKFEENNMFVLQELTHTAALDNLTGIAGRSWFKRDEKLVYPSFGSLKEGLTPANETEMALLRRWGRDVALIYAEEYTHALQDLLGNRMVSRKAALFREANSEADVALLFHEQGVSCSKHFVTMRYPEREYALQLVGGFQTAETQGLFQEALWNTPVGGKLFIGREVSHVTQGTQVFNIPKPANSNDQLGRTAGEAHARLQRVEALLTRNRDGSLEISPTSDESRIFVPNEAGYYFKASGPCTLAPSVPIYVGRAFRLVL